MENNLLSGKNKSSRHEQFFKTMGIAVGLFVSGGLSSAAVATGLLDSAAMEVTQQTVTVKGQVLDLNGEPIIGANILEKGTTNGTITDYEGNFTLNVKPNAVLVVSYIGYASKEIAINDQRTVKITLSEDSEALEEIVVIGYGTVKKADLVGAVAVADNKSFRDQPITSVSEALQGRLSGVQVESSGIPGGSVKIRVRGANSVNKSNDPLYVVDGIVRESGLEGINTDDIQAIQVLKDASSTAIYGSRGSNGVVLITTKKGHAHARNISFDAQVGISNIYKTYDLMNAYEYAQAYMDVNSNPNAFSASELESYKNGGGIDWQDQMFRTAVTQNYKVAVSGGNKDSQYYISGNYMDQEGVFVFNEHKRYNFRTNVSSQVTDWFHITADVNASHITRHGGDSFGAGKGNPIWQSISYSPSMSMFNEDGSYAYDQFNAIGRNPYGLAKLNGSDMVANIFNGMVDLHFHIVKGLTFTSTNGVDYRSFKSYGFSSALVESESGMSNRDYYRLQWQSSNNLTYVGQWGKHGLTATGVFEATKNENRYLGISGSKLLTESVGYWNVELASSRSEGNGYSAWALLSGVGRLMYNYDSRYLLTATLRADGSSKFTDKKWGYFPSVALAWNLSNERFMAQVKSIEDIKIRASYGIVGSQALDAYETLGMLSAANYGYGGTVNYPGYWSHAVSTPDLTWEKTKQVDFGLEFSLLQRRLNFTLDYYAKRTTDALLQKQIPLYDGGGNYWVNAGEITNRGFEFSINARPVETGNFAWSSTLTGTYNKNKVVNLAGDLYISGTTPAAGLIANDGVTRAQVGYPIGSFYVYKWLGIDPATGDNIYEDVNGKNGKPDGKIDSNDRILTGKATPDWTFGWNNELIYKNWTLNAFFNASVGAKRLNLVRFAGTNRVGDSRFITLKEAYYDNWDNNKKNPKYASLKSTTNSMYPNSTQYLENADYLRLQNIALSYLLKKNITKFADIRLSFSCQNLFTITGYSGMDPTAYAFSAGHGDVNSGIDMGGYPNPRTFTFGVKLDF